MRLIPVSLVIFYRLTGSQTLEVWTQVREDDGIYHGLLEFPGGGIEAEETPIEAAIREVQEEVGIEIKAEDAKFMGIYSNHFPGKTIVLNVFLFPYYPDLESKGQWLKVKAGTLSSPYQGKIPGPNHQMIDDLFRSLYSLST